MQDNLIKLIYLFLISFSIFNCLSLKQTPSPIQSTHSQENELIIKITKEYNNKTIRVGLSGILYFVTDYNNNEKHIFNDTEMDEQNIKFNANISDVYKNEYKINCRFWQPSDDNARIFCKFGQYLKYYYQNITINELSFDYNEYKIIIKQDDYIEVAQVADYIPFLYSDKLELNSSFDFWSDTITFKFQIESYNKEELYIYGQEDNNYGILDNCNINETDDKSLICEISPEKMENFFTHKTDNFKIGAIHNSTGIVPFDCILDIKII